MILFALISAFLFGLQDVLKKRVLKKEDSFEFLTLLYIVSFLLLLPFSFKLSFDLSFNVVFLIVLRSLIMIVAIVSFTKALKYLPISTVLPLSNFKPVFALIFAFFFLAEKISLFQILGVLIIISGSYILDSNGSIKKYRRPLKALIRSKYVHYILAFSVFYSLGAILSKTILYSTDSFSLLFYHSFFSMIIYLMIRFVYNRSIKDLRKGWDLAGVWIFLIAILGVGASYVSFLAFASADSKVAIIVPIIQLSTLIGVLGGVFFKEDHILIKSVACILMIIGVLLLVV